MNNWFNVPTAQMLIFAIFQGARLLFDGAFSLWVSLKLCNFVSSWKMIKNTITLCRMLLFHKIKKKMSETFCAFVGMMPLTSNSILCNFITSWELVKAPQNVIQTRLFSRKINKSINDCNLTRTQNHLVRKQTLNHLAKLVRVQLQWLNLQISRLLRARSSLTFRQL